MFRHRHDFNKLILCIKLDIYVFISDYVDVAGNYKKILEDTNAYNVLHNVQWAVLKLGTSLIMYNSYVEIRVGWTNGCNDFWLPLTSWAVTKMLVFGSGYNTTILFEIYKIAMAHSKHVTRYGQRLGLPYVNLTHRSRGHSLYICQLWTHSATLWTRWAFVSTHQLCNEIQPAHPSRL